MLLCPAQLRVAFGQEPSEWKPAILINSPGNVATLQYQEAKKVREIGSLIFDIPLQHDYESGVEVRTLLSTELVKEVEGWMAVTDVDANGQKYVKFRIDDTHDPPTEEQEVQPTVDEHSTKGNSFI